jgi:hypothetical protein
MVDLSEIKKIEIAPILVDLKPEVKTECSLNCGHTDQIRQSILNIKVLNQSKIIQHLNKSYESETENFVNFVEEFSHLIVNGKYNSFNERILKFFIILFSMNLQFLLSKNQVIIQ